MKKLLSLVLAALLLLSFPALAEEGNWYLDTSKELALRVGDLARDEAYIHMMSGVHFPCMDLLKEADFENILSAWRYELPPLKDFLALMGLAGDLHFSDTALDCLNSHLGSTIPSDYNALEGSMAVLASTILTYSRTYPMPENFQPCVIALELDKGAIAVSFSQTGDDTITVTASPLFGAEGASPADCVRELTSVFPGLSMRQIL